MMFKTLLVPVDFSSHSDCALDHAIKLAGRFGGRIHLLHVYQVSIPIATLDYFLWDDLWTGMRDDAARKLRQASQKVVAAGIEVETHLAELPSAQAIVETAEKIGADLIVMGRRGLTGFKHVLLGSVAERTIHTAPCPVATVPDDWNPAASRDDGEWRKRWLA